MISGLIVNELIEQSWQMMKINTRPMANDNIMATMPDNKLSRTSHHLDPIEKFASICIIQNATESSGRIPRNNTSNIGYLMFE